VSDAFREAIGRLDETDFQVHEDTDVVVRIGELGAARLEPRARAWLASTLEALGHHDWARLAGGNGGNTAQR
jgi:hypothetical protein